MYKSVQRAMQEAGIVTEPIKTKPGRRIVAIMHHPRKRGRIERDEKDKYFAVCECSWESGPIDALDLAFKALTGHRGHCSAIHNEGEQTK
jgi:hypothetical protein